MHRSRSLLAVALLSVTAMSTSPVWAKDSAIAVAIPSVPGLYGKITCAGAASAYVPVTVRAHLSLDQTIPSPSIADQGAGTVPSRTIRVFDADLQTTDRIEMSVSSVHETTYVRSVEHPANGPDTVSLDAVREGTSVRMYTPDISKDRRQANLHVQISSTSLLSIRTVQEHGVNVEVPDTQHEELDQTVSVRVGETVDLKTPHGVAHLTLLGLDALPSK